MSLSVEGQKCPVCNAYLFDEEDIVFCPVCGAPHHRECYMHLGHCALEADHGTERQYDANKVAAEQAEKQKQEQEQEEQHEGEKYRCMRCGFELEDEQNVCPRCHMPRMNTAYGTPFGFAFQGPKWKGDTVIEDDITLNDVVPVIGVNAGRYSEKFVMLNRQNRTSWNWAAFLFPAAWAFYRKNFTSGIIMGILQIVAALLNYPMQLLLNSGALPTRPTYAELFALLSKNQYTMWLAVASTVLTLAVAIFSGLFADYMYRKNCIEKAKKIKAAPEQEREMLRYKLGGVNPTWFLLAFMAENYIPVIIMMFLQ